MTIIIWVTLKPTLQQALKYIIKKDWSFKLSWFYQTKFQVFDCYVLIKQASDMINCDMTYEKENTRLLIDDIFYMQIVVRTENLKKKMSNPKLIRY